MTDVFKPGQPSMVTLTVERVIMLRGRYRVTCDVELDIDARTLANLLGHKAVRNKSSKSRLGSGAVIARAVRIVREQLS